MDGEEKVEPFFVFWKTHLSSSSPIFTFFNPLTHTIVKNTAAGEVVRDKRQQNRRRV